MHSTLNLSGRAKHGPLARGLGARSSMGLFSIVSALLLNVGLIYQFLQHGKANPKRKFIGAFARYKIYVQ